MPEFAKPVHGNFCWTEVFLDDPARGKGFYGELFGWGSQEMPTPAGPYIMMKSEENSWRAPRKCPPS